MKRTVLYLFLGIFIALVVQPNISAVPEAVPVRVPEKNPAALQTNESLLNSVSTSDVRICIDPARGGSDTGYQASGQMAEKDLNLALAKAIGAQLESAGYEVVYTREDDNVPAYSSEELSSAYRVAKARELGADYLLCIQLSSDSNSLNQGYSLFTQPGTEITQLASNIASRLAGINFSQFGGIDNDHYSNFPILNDTSLPSIIINFGYVTNSSDYARLADEDYQQRIGSAVAGAFLEEIQ